MYGNMLQMPGIATMEWDYENRLFKAISGTVTSFNNYEAGGERARKVVEKTEQNIKEVRIYFSNFEVYRKYVNDVLETERTTLHISDGQRRIAFFESLTVEAGVTLSTAQDTVRYQYDNHLGSASLELDENANTISYEEYYPFGTSSYRLHRNSTEASLKRYRYVGKERDEETGLYYYGARYYAAHIARFVSVDPLQHKYPHYTPYQYAGNRPITFIDLDGLEPAEKIVEESRQAVMKVAWKKGSQEAAKKGASKLIASQILKRISIWTTVWEIFTSGKDSPQSLANDYYQKALNAGKEDWFWKYWQGAPHYYPKPPVVNSPELEDWMQNYWPEGVPLNLPNVEPATNPQEEEEEDEPSDLFIYRGGSFTYKNLTPRPGKDDIPGPKSGLSAWLTHEQATFGKGGKSQKLSVARLKKFGFDVNITPDGHVGIRPPSQEKLEEWANGRENVEKGKKPHIFTIFVELSRTNEVKTPKVK